MAARFVTQGRALLKVRKALGPEKFKEKKDRLLVALLAAGEMHEVAEAVGELHADGFFDSEDEVAHWTDRMLGEHQDGRPSLPSGSQPGAAAMTGARGADDPPELREVLGLVAALTRAKAAAAGELLWSSAQNVMAAGGPLCRAKASVDTQGETSHGPEEERPLKEGDVIDAPAASAMSAARASEERSPAPNSPGGGEAVVAPEVAGLSLAAASSRSPGASSNQRPTTLGRPGRFPEELREEHFREIDLVI